MGQYLLKKLMILPLLLIFITIVVFSIRVLVPGDPIEIMFFGERPPEEVIQQIRADFGLDKPVYTQYFIFMRGALRGDLGVSYRTRRLVTDEIAARFPRTLQLAIVSLAISTIGGIFAGVVSAYKKDSFFDLFIMGFSILGISMPIFVLGLILINVFSVNLGWFPVYGTGTWRHMVLPAITLGVVNIAVIARVTRSSMLEELRKDYVRTARSKGVRENIVLFRHTLKNAIIPIITLMGLRFGNLLGSAFITETVFAWHGIGELGVNAIQARDFPLVQGIVLVIAISYVLINTFVDIIYGFLNPRIRFQ